MDHPPRPSQREMVIFERWIDSVRWLMDRTARFPKRLRHSLTERIELLALGVLEDLTAARWRSQPARTLRRADERLDRLKVLVRLAYEIELLSAKQYEEAATRMVEVGRMLGGRRARTA